MKKTIFWIVVMFLLMLVPCLADMGPPGEGEAMPWQSLTEECVLAVPSLLNPQQAVIGNDVSIEIGEWDLQKQARTEFLYVYPGYIRLESSDRSIIEILGQNPVIDKNRNYKRIGNVVSKHPEFG